MTTKTLFIISLFISQVSYGQNAKLKIFNPAPRLGDAVTITITIIADSSIAKKEDTLLIHNGDGEITLRKLMPKVGKYTIGPFSFKINGKTYTSDSLEITIDAKLPDEREGVWLRQIKWKGDEYLILEQRIDLEKLSESKRMNVYEKFVDLSDKAYEYPDEIWFSFAGSTSPRQPTEEISDQIIVGKGQVIYKLTMYRITKGKEYKGSFSLGKKFFTNLSGTSNFSEFEIK